MYFIYPSDESTEFLLEIPKIVAEKYGSKSNITINIKASDDSYSNCFEKVKMIPPNSTIIFMGHGQANQLWGAESETFIKKPFVKQNESKIFGGSNLFLLSCDSNEFLKGSYSYSKVINSIGFGSLPTVIEEFKQKRKLRELEVNENVVRRFRLILIDLISVSFCEMIKKDMTFYELFNYLVLRLNKKISRVILDDKRNNENRVLADLLYYIKSEMVYI